MGIESDERLVRIKICHHEFEGDDRAPLVNGKRLRLVRTCPQGVQLGLATHRNRERGGSFADGLLEGLSKLCVAAPRARATGTGCGCRRYLVFHGSLLGGAPGLDDARLRLGMTRRASMTAALIKGSAWQSSLPILWARRSRMAEIATRSSRPGKAVFVSIWIIVASSFIVQGRDSNLCAKADEICLRRKRYPNKVSDF